MRLTSKTKILSDDNYNTYHVLSRLNDNEEDIVTNAINKLWRLENIEDKLGISLENLFDTLFSTFIFVKENDDFTVYSKFKVDIINNKIHYNYEHGKGYNLNKPLSEFNISWGLNKKEIK